MSLFETRLIGTLDRDTDAHTVVARMFEEIAGFRGCDQQISIR